MNKKEIKELIAHDENRIHEIEEGYKKIPEYKKLQEEVDELNRKKSELEKRQIELKVKYREDSKEDLEFAREELKYSRELLRKAEMGLNPKDYNDELIEMFKAFYSGSTYGSHKKLQWVSDDGRYAIFKVRAHAEYIDRMSGSRAAEVEWALFRIDPEFNKENNRSHRLDPRSHLCLWRKETGRWGENRDMKIVNEVIYNYENNDFVSNFMKANGFEYVYDHLEHGWVNKNIVIKYTSEWKPSIGPDKGKTIIREHERFCTLSIRSEDYYVNMPTNEEEFKNKYPGFWDEWQKNK